MQWLQDLNESILNHLNNVRHVGDISGTKRNIYES
jgi:hypothetical protein